MFLALAVPSSAITWPEAVKLLRANNNELRSAQKQLEVSGWSYRRAYTAFLPQLSANASANSTSAATQAASSSFSYGLSASLDLFNPSDFYSLRSAYADHQLNQANYDLASANVLYQARTAFINLLAAQTSAGIQKKIFGRRQENTRLIQLRYDSGVEDKGSLMRTQADEANARYNLSSAERDLRLARLNLSQLLGQTAASAEGEMTFAGSAEADLEPLVTAAPSYRAAKYQLEAAEIQQQSTLSEFLPALTLAGNYRKSGGSWPPDSDSNSLSLSLSYAFFPGGANFIDKAIGDLRLDKGKEDFAKAVKDTRYSIESAYEAFSDALEALAVARVVLSATTVRSDIAQEKYINGLLSYDEWYIIENEYISAQSGLINAEKNVLLAEAAWQKSYGGYVR